MTFVIFDVDGTLVYSNKVDSQTFAQAYLEIFKKPLPSINWEEYPHVTDETILTHLFEQDFGRKPTQIEKLKLQDRFVELLEKSRIETPEKFKAVPNSVDAVRQLMKMKNYCVGIATGGWQRPATLKLKHIGLSLEGIFAAYADGKYTRPDIINDAIEQAKAKYPMIDRIVYVGDAPWDVSTTRDMKIPFIGIRWRDDKDILYRKGARYILQDYNDFEEFMKMVELAEVPR